MKLNSSPDVERPGRPSSLSPGKRPKRCMASFDNLDASSLKQTAML